MAQFCYEALTEGGRLLRGSLEASSREEAQEQLAAMELTVHQLEVEEEKAPQVTLGRTEFLLFNRQLAAIAEAGIPLERALRELSHDLASRRARHWVTVVADELERGRSLEEVFERHREHFPPLYSRIIEAGVRSGRLGEMLQSLNRHLETTEQTRRLVVEATVYPLMIFFVALLVMSGLLLFVVPSFTSMYSQMQGPLPQLTQWLFTFSQHIVHFWVGLAAFVLVLWLVRVLLRRSRGGRRWWERRLFSLPLVGRLLQVSLLSRLADAMALLVGAGCDLPTCLSLGAAAAGSEALQEECQEVAARLEEGEKLLEAGKSCQLVPRLFFYSTQVGAQRNDLLDNLYGLSEMYARQAAAYQGRLQAGLLPLMLLVVGVLVGLVVLSLFMPYLQMLNFLSVQ